MRAPEIELRALLEDQIQRGDIGVCETAEVNRLLLKSFPFKGSWIDWSQVRIHQTAHQPSGALVEADFSAFFDACLGGMETKRCFFANDGLQIAFKASLDTFRANLPVLINQPQTTYFLAVDESWCMTLFTNGQMNFGEAA